MLKIKKYNLKLIFYLLVLSFVSCHYKPNQNSKVQPPNVIVIFIDDMGYGDIEPFGSTINSTPHLNKMAEEGMKLTNFYVPSPVCTPSRASLMTGSYPQRVGLNRGSEYIVLFPGDHHVLNPNEITIAELLKSKGYATGCFGKWHLGDQLGSLPTDQGFDDYYGIPYSNDMWAPYKKWDFPNLPVMKGNKVDHLVLNMQDQALLCKEFTDAAVSFIKKNKEKPFFCYIPHAFVHWPRLARASFMENASSPEEAQIEEIDWSVGEIIKTIKNLELQNNTLILFTSDNGPASGLSAGPLRGIKGSAYEGGYRVPTIAWWPNKIPANSISNEMATTMDLFTTLGGLAGADMPKDRIIDGKNILPILLAAPHAKTPHDRFFYQEKGELAAVRSGDWKLFLNGELYNLKNDISESQNVAAANPKIVDKLNKMILDFEDDIAKNSRHVGVVKTPRTLVPRPGVKGEDAYAPTLSLPFVNKQ